MTTTTTRDFAMEPLQQSRHCASSPEHTDFDEPPPKYELLEETMRDAAVRAPSIPSDSSEDLLLRGSSLDGDSMGGDSMDVVDGDSMSSMERYGTERDSMDRDSMDRSSISRDSMDGDSMNGEALLSFRCKLVIKRPRFFARVRRWWRKKFPRREIRLDSSSESSAGVDV